MSIRVLVADDQAIVRAGFCALIDAQADMEVVGEAGDGLGAVELGRRLRPDVVVMDVRMPKMDGLEATRLLLADQATSTRVLVLTTFDLDEYVYEALRAGASGFLLKDANRDELLAAIRVVAAGDALLAPAITRRLIRQFTQYGRPPAVRPEALTRLTPREVEVLTLIARGLSNREIAGSLVVAEQTVKTHVGRVLTKLGLRDRAQAVVVAYETRLVQPSTG